MSLQIGQVFHERYRIQELLGQGGFGAVYRALDTNLEEPVAIKESLETSPVAQKQFQLEARLLFRLVHPGLPRVHDTFVIPGQGMYLVMDCVQGENLQTILESRRGPLPEAQVLAWAGQVCAALSYLHSQSPPVIHRDIKPANIRITPTGRAMLVDFGIAKLYDPQAVTTQGARAVTRGYSPPEQYGLGATDARSDIYALGATLYCLLTGKAPPDSVDRITQSGAALRPAQALNPGVSPGVSAAIEKAMALEREQRWNSVEAFQAALLAPADGVAAQNVTIAPVAAAVLQPFKAGPPQAAAPLPRTVAAPAAGSTARPPGGAPEPPAAAHPSGRGMPRFAWLALAGAALALLVICSGSLGYLGWRQGRPQPTLMLNLAGTSAPATPPGAAPTLTPATPLAVVTDARMRLVTASRQATRLPVTNNPITLPTATPSGPRPTATTRAGETRTSPSDGMIQAFIPAGAFWMGAITGNERAKDHEKPQHEVYLDDFWIDTTEVTNGMYALCVKAGACKLPLGGSDTREVYYSDSKYADFPVIWVTWEQAKAYCDWAGRRLPTEAEWEKAARGGLDRRLYPWGDQSPDCSLANFERCEGDTQRVGSYPPNGYGLFDMAGNVAEWVQDWYDRNYYTTNLAQNPSGPATGTTRVTRGYTWWSLDFYLRASARDTMKPTSRDSGTGFRCAR